jgi:hypothetical protein
MFHYHKDGSKKLNACNQFFLSKVYFNLNTKSRYSQIVYYSIYTLDTTCINPTPCSSLPALLFATPHSLLPALYLLGEPAFLLVVRIPIRSCPWFAINCPPFAASPTLTHPTDQVTIFT